MICNFCVLDDKIPGVRFDEDNRCNYCKNLEEKFRKIYFDIKKNYNSLEKILEKIKSQQKGKYNCIVGASGGIDSSFLLHLVKQWGLTPLVVHLNNGWDTELSIQNIQKIIKKLNFDYFEYKLDFEEFRRMQIAFLKASVPDLENLTDMAILGALHRVAYGFKVKYILLANNFVSEGILPKFFLYNPKDKKYIKAIIKEFSDNLKIKNFPFFSIKEEFFYKLKGIRLLYPLNYICYSPLRAKKILQEEYDFQIYEQKHSESLITFFVQAYYLPKKFNIDYRKATLSSLICSGEITRTDAIDKLNNRTNLDENELLNNVAQKLKISVNDLICFLNLPPKYYKDFPNAEFYHKIVKFFFNLFFRRFFIKY